MIHAQAPTKALAWKVVQLFDRFVLFCTYVHMYGRTLSPEIMNHFSSLCLGVDQFIVFYEKVTELLVINYELDLRLSGKHNKIPLLFWGRDLLGH